VDDIHESGIHLLSLINDILDISKIEAGKAEMIPTAVSVLALLEHSTVMIRETALKHNIALRRETTPAISDLIIQADERKLKQVMFNLLSNAAKFTPDGGAITVKAYCEDSGLVIAVQDSGIGVPWEMQERVFEPFYQGNADLMLGKPSGTGLGLSLTRQFVGMHGGRIWVESEGEGKGSTFFFTLPIRQAAAGGCMTAGQA
jgi:signal transduction histidine kinase